MTESKRVLSGPVAWGIFDSQGFYEAALDEESARRFCDQYNRRPVDPLKPYFFSPLFIQPASASLPLQGAGETLTEAEIDHLWDTHVGDPTPSRPLTGNDVYHFAHAIIAKLDAKRAGGGNVKQLLAFLHRATCSHRVYIEDIKRVCEMEARVEAPCNRCAKILKAPYGLALNAKLEQRGHDYD